MDSNLARTIFRAYDIRGIFQQDLTEEIVELIGQAIGTEAQIRGERQIIMARDGRYSGPVLSQALAKGLLASGCDVINIGEVPTPVLYFATHKLSTHSGVMLTGSHNPPEYNGLKIVLNGETLADQAIQDLYQRIISKNLSTGQGSQSSYDIQDEYVNYISADIKLARPLKIVIDCGNGVTGHIAPRLFQALGCQVIPLFCEVNGYFPNHHPDPSYAENLQDLQRAVIEHGADVGLAFDGDGDRLGVVTDQGEIIWPDRQLMLYAKTLLPTYPGAYILFDVKCSRHLITVIEAGGGKPFMWKTGHSLIKNKLRELKAPVAGEMSGHTFFYDRWFGFDDGLYTAARLLEILAGDSRTASTIFKELPDSINTPELKLPMREEQKFLFIDRLQAEAKFDNAKIITIDGLRVDFADGWGLIRASNTSPYLILRFEADTAEALHKIQSIFRQQLLALDNDLELPF